MLPGSEVLMIRDDRVAYNQQARLFTANTLTTLSSLNDLKSLAIYGAGTVAKALLPHLGDRVRLVIDRDRRIQGSIIYGHEVCSVEDLSKELKNIQALIITVLGSRHEIIQQIETLLQKPLRDLVIISFDPPGFEQQLAFQQSFKPVRSGYKYDFAMVFCPRWGTNFPWTATAYILETVRFAGFTAQSFDYNMKLYRENGIPELWNENIYHQYWKINDLNYFLDQIDIREIDASVVGFSLTETNLKFSIELARRIRRADPNKLIVFGGHRVFFQGDADSQIPLDACDVIVKGEGEKTIIDILNNGVENNIGTYTPGIARWIFNGDRELVKDLDAIPWPRYEDIDWRHYPDGNLAIMGSRGCIHRCVFCNDVVRGRHKFRSRSAENIADEMFYHAENNPVKWIFFNDPLINGNFRILEKLCDLLIRRGFGIPWGSNLAIRSKVPDRLFEKMYQAGFRVAVVGMESGSPKILKRMNKVFGIDIAEQFINSVHAAGIKIELNLIVGFPGETETEFQETCDFLKRNADKLCRIVSVATLNFDRSELWEHPTDYDIVFHEHDRHISWHTKDMSNTYEIRCNRAERLIQLAQSLGLMEKFRFDADIERKDWNIGVEELKHRKALILQQDMSEHVQALAS
jgi:hypothetical protein